MKKFKSNKNASIDGTSLKGYLQDISFEKLVEVFGKPVQGDDYKVAFEWVVQSECGEILTIYPWKNTDMYDDSLPSVSEMKKTNTEWNVGGHKNLVEDLNNFLKG